MEHRGSRAKRIVFTVLRAIGGGIGRALSLLAWTYIPFLLIQYAIGRFAAIPSVSLRDYLILLPLLFTFAVALGVASLLTSCSPFNPVLRLLGRLFDILAFILLLNLLTISTEVLSLYVEGTTINVRYGPVSIMLDLQPLFLILLLLYAGAQAFLDFYSYHLRAMKK